MNINWIKCTEEVRGRSNGIVVNLNLGENKCVTVLFLIQWYRGGGSPVGFPPERTQDFHVQTL